MAETQTQPAFQLKSRAEMYLAHNHINELIANKPNGLNRAEEDFNQAVAAIKGPGTESQLNKVRETYAKLVKVGGTIKADIELLGKDPMFDPNNPSLSPELRNYNQATIGALKKKTVPEVDGTLAEAKAKILDVAKRTNLQVPAVQASEADIPAFIAAFRSRQQQITPGIGAKP
jgi:hypothetical protein